MKKVSLLISAFYLSISLSFGQDFFNSANSFFGAHVTAGKVDYSSVMGRPEMLNTLVSQVSKYNLTNAENSEIKAFYINAYNILVIKGVIDNYPIKSPLDKDGFFDKEKYEVAGEMLTLNDIENKKIREVFNDPRIHFVLVCAAESCPKLISSAYFPSMLEDQLNERSKVSLNDSNFIKVNGTDVEISEIFKWYAEDFGGKDNFKDFINKYRNEKLPQNSNIGYYEYDWSLNEKK